MNPVSAIHSTPPSAAPAAAAAPRRDFAAALGAAPASGVAFGSLTAPLRELETSRQRIQGLLAQAMEGRRFSPSELLALQAGVYRLNTELELAAKVVEGANSAVRRALATEV